MRKRRKMEWESDQALLSAVINGLSVIKPVVQIPILMMYLAFLATNPITSTKYLTSCDAVALIESVWRCSVNLSIHPHHFNAESVYNLMFIYVHCIGIVLIDEFRLRFIKTTEIEMSDWYFFSFEDISIFRCIPWINYTRETWRHLAFGYDNTSGNYSTHNVSILRLKNQNV